MPRMATCAVEQLRKERLHTSASPTCLHGISNGSRRPTRISQSRQVSTLVELASLLKQLPCLPHGVPTRALSSRQRSVSCFKKSEHKQKAEAATWHPLEKARLACPRLSRTVDGFFLARGMAEGPAGSELNEYKRASTCTEVGASAVQRVRSACGQ